MIGWFKHLAQKCRHRIERGSLIHEQNRIILDKLNQSSMVNKGIQILLKLKYQGLKRAKTALPALEEVEFRCFSENGEDGILLYIFSLIGTSNKKTVEICAGDGRQCNAANLIVNHGWEALLFDGNQEAVERGRAFYAKHKDTLNWPPKFIHAWITAENVNDLLSESGFQGEIDLLSLDMDGNDYWIWKAIDVVAPRVVVLEYQDIWGPKKAVTVPYRPDFVANFGPFGPDYCGASLAAFVKLGKQKGYRLVGCERYGYNAFFIRKGIEEDIFPEIPASECFKHPKVQFGMKHRLPNVSHKEWIEV